MILHLGAKTKSVRTLLLHEIQQAFPNAARLSRRMHKELFELAASESNEAENAVLVGRNIY
jgi:hypothetical protein